MRTRLLAVAALPLLLLPLGGCALLPLLPTAPARPPAERLAPVEQPLALPESEAQPQLTVEHAIEDFEAYLAVSSAVAMGLEHPDALHGHLDVRLQALEAETYELIEQEGLFSSAPLMLGEADGLLVGGGEGDPIASLTVCVLGAHVEIGSSGDTIGDHQYAVESVASEATGWHFTIASIRDTGAGC
jgi:hypothetical protein